MRHWLAVAILTAALMTVAPVAFHAQQQCQLPKCGPYLMLRAAIATCFGEVPMMTGILGAGERRMIMFVDPNDTSWTVGELTTSGMFCITGTGNALDTSPKTPEGDPS